MVTHTEKIAWVCVYLLILSSLISCDSSLRAMKEQGQIESALTVINLPPEAYSCGGERFESDLYHEGSIHGQNGWTTFLSSFSQEIVRSDSACRGNGMWKLSNSVTDGGYWNQPSSPVLTHGSGESGVRRDGDGDAMSLSFFFRTVAPNADGSEFTVSLSPEEADRHVLLTIVNDTNAKGGLQIVTTEFKGSFVSRVLARNLSRTEWHHVKISSQLVDRVRPTEGPNDIVTIFVNGKFVYQQTSWEKYFWDRKNANKQKEMRVDRLVRTLFRLPPNSMLKARFPDGRDGFFIDDLKQWTFDSANPSVVIDQYNTGFEL
ncbi:MAG: hypothetical protein AB7F59_08155 [Bdellovibrionales bacterium]